jgi:serine/threonine protein kinase
MGHPELLSVARDMARGMHYLHSCHLIHRDLKSQNVLLDRPVENGCPTLKIADFGLSRDFHGGSGVADDSVAAVMTSETGTYRYMSPNIIRHEPYNTKADVYSFAVTVWEMFSCEIPFSGMTPIQAAFAVADKGLRPSAVSEHARANPVPPAWQCLIEHCWHDDPHLRPRFVDIIKVLDEMETHGPLIKPPFWAKWTSHSVRPSPRGPDTSGGGGSGGGGGVPVNSGRRGGSGRGGGGGGGNQVGGSARLAGGDRSAGADKPTFAWPRTPSASPPRAPDESVLTANPRRTGMSHSGSAPSLAHHDFGG